MNAWDYTDFASRENVLSTVREEAETMLAMAADPGAWTAPTGAGHWQVRDVIGHMVDTTEGYFKGFAAARGQGDPPDSVPLVEMAKAVDRGAQQFHDAGQEVMIDRLRADLGKMLGTFEALTEQEWTGLGVPHKYMGPLPPFFYPIFQLVDYAVHNWDIREGTGRPHALSARSADLLVPLMFVLWSATSTVGPETEPMELGIRVTSGPNAGDTKLSVGPGGVAAEPGPIDSLGCVLEFDPASLILTAYGRTNAGTIRGDRARAERFLASFFRI